MSSEPSISGSLGSFYNHDEQKVEELIRQGRSTEALSCVENILNQDGNNLRIIKLGYRAASDIRNWQMALSYINKVIQLAPNNDLHKKRKIILLANNKEYKQAIELANLVGDSIYEDPAYLDALKVSYYHLGDQNKAREMGQISIEKKDKGACQEDNKLTALTRYKGKKNIISFSLWGKNKSYQMGAMVNAVLARYIYPGWICRYYVSNDIRKDVIDFLVNIGCEVISMDNSLIPGYFWRFLVLSDSSVNMFICRDCDCRLGSDEYLLVKQWQSSGKSFHIIRDHIFHNDLILAGLWGGFATPMMDIELLINDFFKGKPSNEYHADQVFLERHIWSKIRGDLLMHDSNYELDEIQRISIDSCPDNHIGCGYMGFNLLRTEQLLYDMPQII
jgi:tetratricopeptide (TPR) repeat protein